MKIGLTGGIATGKSTVARMFIERGALLVDADRIAREVVEPGTPLLAEIAAHFLKTHHEHVLAADGSLDRKKLGSIIFSDSNAKKALESLIHPPIRTEIIAQMNRLDAQHPNRAVIVDIPLLFESKYDYMFSEVVLVYVPREMQLERLMTRDGIDRKQAEQRLAAQMPIEEKRSLATVVIDNTGDLAATERQVENFLRCKGLHAQTY